MQHLVGIRTLSHAWRPCPSILCTLSLPWSLELLSSRLCYSPAHSSQESAGKRCSACRSHRMLIRDGIQTIVVARQWTMQSNFSSHASMSTYSDKGNQDAPQPLQSTDRGCVVLCVRRGGKGFEESPNVCLACDWILDDQLPTLSVDRFRSPRNPSWPKGSTVPLWHSALHATLRRPVPGRKSKCEGGWRSDKGATTGGNVQRDSWSDASRLPPLAPAATHPLLLRA